MNVGIRIRQLRKVHNITTLELSKLCGISQSTISKLENGNRIPDVPTISKICSALHISLSDFFALDDTSEPMNQQLIELMYIARNLNEEQLESLSDFLKTFVDKGTGDLSTAESE